MFGAFYFGQPYFGDFPVFTKPAPAPSTVTKGIGGKIRAPKSRLRVPPDIFDEMLRKEREAEEALEQDDEEVVTAAQLFLGSL